ncbi:MAG: hypothetical protein LBH69_02875, partial [Methanomassiliicoccaceae archaeon]|nr:hypothetical protein [Methanomassiliicoccaceae archaeon]
PNSDSVFESFRKNSEAAKNSSPQTYTVADDDIIYAKFALKTDGTFFNIVVNVTGNGSVSVMNGATELANVSVTSTIAVPVGTTTLTFVASPNSDSVCESFKKNSETARNSSPQTYTVADDDIIYVKFALKTDGTFFNIVVNVTGNGSVSVMNGTTELANVSVTSTIAVPVGTTSLTFIARPNSDSVFESFRKNSEAARNTSPQTYTVADDDVIYAKFALKTDGTFFNIVVNVTGNGSVSVMNGTTEIANVQVTSLVAIPADVTSLTFIASPGNDHVFESFRKNSETAKNSSPQTYTVADGDVIYVIFEEYNGGTSGFNITLIVDGDGSVTVEGHADAFGEGTWLLYVNAGTSELEFTAAANSGSVFRNMIRNNSLPQTIAQWTYPVEDGDVIIVAFTSESNMFTITPDETLTGGHLEWSLDGTVWHKFTGPLTLIKGTDVHVRAVAGDGHEFSAWAGDISGSTVNPYLFEAMEDDCFLSAVFKAAPLNENSVRNYIILFLILLFILLLSILLITYLARMRIVGTITHNGGGLANVSVVYTVTNKKGEAVTTYVPSTTDMNGRYLILMERGWTVTITEAVLSGYAVSTVTMAGKGEAAAKELPLSIKMRKKATEVNFAMEKE